jgi:diphosphomevalonate decarboxylase
MHSVMWTSRPPVVYWNASTLACLERVRELRADGLSAFFTIDAGPQVKVVCLPGDERHVVEALSGVDGVESVLASGIGAGAALVTAE